MPIAPSISAKFQPQLPPPPRFHLLLHRRFLLGRVEYRSINKSWLNRFFIRAAAFSLSRSEFAYPAYERSAGVVARVLVYLSTNRRRFCSLTFL